MSIFSSANAKLYGKKQGLFSVTESGVDYATISKILQKQCLGGVQ